MSYFLGNRIRTNRFSALLAPLVFTTIIGCSADQIVGRDASGNRAGSGTRAGSGGASHTSATQGGRAGDASMTTLLGGTAGIANATGGTGGAPPNQGGAAGFCNGLDGTWTARFKLDTWTREGSQCWVSENGMEPAFKADAPGALGMTLTSTEGKCAAKLYPEFGGVIETEMSSTAAGLELAPTTSTLLRWCHPMNWDLRKLTVLRSTPPTARLEVQLGNFCDDVSFGSSTTWNGTLTEGLFHQAIRLKSENPLGLVCGWGTSEELPLRVLPWHNVITKTALPAERIFASASNPELKAPWPLPLSYDAVQSQTEDMLWVVSADHAASAYVQIAHTKLAPAFEGDTLAQLATKGTSGIEVVGNVPTLRLSGKRCTEPIWAGGRLQVAGKQRVVFEIEGLGNLVGSTSNEPGTIRARVIDPAGADTPRAVWAKVEGTSKRVATVALAGQAEVGVELAWDIDCAPISIVAGNPDLRIYAIRAE